jgi:hypothetical protein
MVASCLSFGSGQDALPENAPPVVRQSLRLISPSALPRESYALEGLIWLTARFEIGEIPNHGYPTQRGQIMSDRLLVASAEPSAKTNTQPLPPAGIGRSAISRMTLTASGLCAMVSPSRTIFLAQ